MTSMFWADFWFYWLLFFLVSWVVAEIASLIWAHATGQKHIQDWTLSDTIRRWSSARRWLAPLVIAITFGLVWHFFGMQNPS